MTDRAPSSPRVRDRYAERDYGRGERDYKRERSRSRSPPIRDKSRDDRGYGRERDRDYERRDYRSDRGDHGSGGRGGYGGSRGGGGYSDRGRDHGGSRGGRGGYGGDRGEYAGDRGGYGGDRGDRAGHSDKGGYRDRGGFSGRRGGRAGYEERDRPLDRRAIEEGRRKREEDRAKGVVLDDPRRDGSGSPYPDIKDEKGTPEPKDGDEDGEEDFSAMMGFGGFGTTKGKGVGQNAEGAVNVHKQRTWRQYMNRRGGFNRPLEKMK